MTHDELLAKIDETKEWINSTPLLLEFQTRLLNQHKALRAVVELHKPFLYPEDDCIYCEEDNQPFPCESIQAIEKELG